MGQVEAVLNTASSTKEHIGEGKLQVTRYLNPFTSKWGEVSIVEIKLSLEP